MSYILYMNLTKKLLLAIFLLLLLFSVGVFIYGYKNIKTEPLVQEQKFSLFDEYLTNVINPDEELGGKILITSAYLDATSTSDAVNQKVFWDDFVYDVSSEIIFELDAEDTLYFLDQDLTSGRRLFVGDPTYADDSGVYNPTLNIMDGQNFYVQETAESSFADVLYRLRLPRWSPEGNGYVYSSQLWNTSDIPPEFDNLGTWHVGVLNSDTSTPQTELFASGYNAEWADAGSYIVYIKEDGIYAKRFVVGEDHLLTPEAAIITDQYGFAMRHHIDVSPDGHYLAVSYPIKPEITNSLVSIYKLSFTGAIPTATLIHQIMFDDATSPYWPLFSPEGRYLSLQSRQQKEGATDSNILIYDFLNQNFIQSTDFNRYNFDTSFNTDWVKVLDAE